MKYRKKQIVVEAFQITEARIHCNQDWPSWANEAWNTDPGPGSIYLADLPDRTLVCGTLEGDLAINPDDWIIRGIEGELYPCKPDIFTQTYEPA